MRKEYPDFVARLPRLPEKALFRRLAPAVVDARKTQLEAYLQGLLALVPTAPTLLGFLGSDIKASRSAGAVRRRRHRGPSRSRPGLTH